MGRRQENKSRAGEAPAPPLTGGAYVAFLLGPPMVIGLVMGASEFGSVQFTSKSAHIAYGLFTFMGTWISLELCSQLGARALRPWAPALWVILILGSILSGVLHAPFTLLRDPVFEPFVAEGSQLFKTWPWNYSDPKYAMESALATTNRAIVWVACNFMVVAGFGYSRLGYDRVFGPAPTHNSTERQSQTLSNGANSDEQSAAHPILADRLPPELGNQISLLHAQGHYTQVETDKGSALVYLRFSDAEKLASEVAAGMRVHRSFWVAFNAVDNATIEGSKMSLTLKSGRQVPVSRTYRERARELLLDHQ